MNQSELEEILLPLRKDLQERIDSKGMLQAIINKHIQTINKCIDQNVTTSLIYSNIFPDQDISFNHLKNLIYRARAKLAKGKINLNNKKGENNNYTQIQNENTENAENTNAFSFLAKREEPKPIHDSRSDRQAADERVKKLLQEKLQKEKEAKNENK